MALTTGAKDGDMSGCVEMTVDYFGYNRFESGKIGICFDFTGGSDENIIGKDPTMGQGDTTGACKTLALYVDYIQLNACSTGAGGPVAICDGSGGVPFVSLAIHDGSLTSSNSASWDFGKDPLVCLTADNTQSLCVSSAANAYISGFVKCYWGPIPK